MAGEANSNAGKGLSLMMTLKEPGTLGDLKSPDGWLAKMQGAMNDALNGLRCVHYARILPLEDQPPEDQGPPLSERGVVLFIMEYDGEKKSFLTDFANALPAHLGQILEKMNGWPVPNPSDDFPSNFLRYVEKCEQMEASLFSGYKGVSVVDILKSHPEDSHGSSSSVSDVEDHTRQKSAGEAFNLVMDLDDPLKLRDLMMSLAAPENKARIDEALASLDYVHFARFLPLVLPPSQVEPRGRSLLLIVTEFDGVMDNYVMDFAAALDREFTMIIGYMKGRPLLPVSKHPHGFWQYVKTHLQKPAYFFSSYPGITVLQIAGTGKPKKLPHAPIAPKVDIAQEDVQANVLKGFGADRAFHYHLKFQDAASAKKFIRELQVTPSLSKLADGTTKKADSCINIGFTWAGLQTLELDESILNAFPEAFRIGAAGRADRVEDKHASAPEKWEFGRAGEGDKEGEGKRVHAVVSLHLKPGIDPKNPLADLEKMIEGHGITFEDRLGSAKYAQNGEALGGHRVHFGYRDGISQPHFAGIHEDVNAVPGDFLLGTNFINSRGGNYIGRLPSALAQNATYAAYRVMAQHVDKFEKFLADTVKEDEREELAAKLMGRWRNGAPITRYADAALPDTAIDHVDLDDFDYASPSGIGDDSVGARCPFGAHIRRFNPRSGMVLGVPWGRLVIRRGLPYTYMDQPEETSRGLVGMFMCGDLESQFEFLLGVWGRQDLSSFGLQGSQDPITSTSPNETPFTYTSSTGQQVTVQVPTLTRTIGSLYLFMPGLNGLKVIAESEPESKGKDRSKAEKPTVPLPFDITSKRFRDNPYEVFSELRERQPVYKVGGGHNGNWVLSHKLVTEVCENADRFLKPGHNRDPQNPPFGLNGNTDDGLFFMDPPRHTQVRPVMNAIFFEALMEVEPKIMMLNENLLGTLDPKLGLEFVSQYATLMAAGAFMEIMGIPDGQKGMPPLERQMVALWTKAMLDGHDPNADQKIRGAGGSSSLALRSYLSALTKDQTRRDPNVPRPKNIMEGLRKSACPYVPPALNQDEVINTASHFALGGYLSTEFLITTGIYNLLANRDQWELLLSKSEDEYVIKGALWEMLRYDAPFQMADRWVAENCVLGDYPLTKGEKVTVVYGSANRDPAVFGETADRFDISRELNAKQIYGFGHGIHYCIGSDMALMVASAAIMKFVKTFPKAEFAVKDGGGAWLPDPYFRSRDKLMINLVPKKQGSSEKTT